MYCLKLFLKKKIDYLISFLVEYHSNGEIKYHYVDNDNADDKNNHNLCLLNKFITVLIPEVRLMLQINSIMMMPMTIVVPAIVMASLLIIIWREY